MEAARSQSKVMTAMLHFTKNVMTRKKWDESIVFDQLLVVWLLTLVRSSELRVVCVLCCLYLLEEHFNVNRMQ